MDIKDFRWIGAIKKFNTLGDLRPISDLIRSEAIPEAYRAEIADIFIDQKRSISGNSEVAKSYNLKRFYYDRAHMVAIAVGKKIAIQQIADRFYNGSYEAARVTIARKVKKYNWTELPDQLSDN